MTTITEKVTEYLVLKYSKMNEEFLRKNKIHFTKVDIIELEEKEEN